MMSFRSTRPIFQLHECLSSFQIISVLDMDQHRQDWKLGHVDLLHATTNYIYHMFIKDHKWVEQKANSPWHLYKSASWWCKTLFRGWLTFKGKVFIWRAIVVGLPLVAVLHRRMGLVSSVRHV